MPSDTKTTLKPTDLRGILEYVPQFRDHVFVIALDGSIIDDENFSNVITDIAVLRSLNIDIVLVHGIGRQIKRLSEECGIPISDAHGSGATDGPTLEMATAASSEVLEVLTRALTQNGLRYVVTNAVRATETGVIRGKDLGYTGKIEKLDEKLIRLMLSEGVVPVFSPLACDRDGQPYRLNSDQLASELAIRLKASKLIYLTPFPGLVVDGEPVMNIPLDELQSLITKHKKSLDERLLSKAAYAARTLEAGTPRAHILDGRIFGGLLTEIFDKVGLGTMIHANDYQQIRAARKKDAASIFAITRNAAKSETLRTRTRHAIEEAIGNFYVYEIDESIVGCFSLVPLDGKTVELGAVLVQPFYQGRGVGKKLVEFACLEARRMKADRVVALSTQAGNFFRDSAGFAEGTQDDLPKARREDYIGNSRHSKVYVKRLAPARKKRARRA
ncbi:amino-acid N-acetyltransferase [Ruficoccus amylovorans]|uniref:amino-acid N-acetyltransferase n=1 Tax=Ruficoccus amylovorans TaxID=1804625 RepID=A0A842HGG6_9BACT|nr:amino-acid N-acetyltransferase [Ruficoccus amylovorans]MBC2595785.1 amino-acid N-acetyltransferase [Ruficoccus amylovorans]